MEKLTEKHKRYIGIGVALLVVIHFLPRWINAIHPAQGPPAMAKPSAVRTAPVQPPPAPSPEIIAANKYGGIWEGDTLMPNQNRCAVRLEIRISDDVPKKLKGYGTVRCMPLEVLARGPRSRGAAGEMVREYASPASAVMTATPANAGLNFTVDQIVSAARGNCAISAFSITDFGDNQVMADWQEGTCDPGKMLLRKKR
jgi:hypothetical protein